MPGSPALNLNCGASPHLSVSQEPPEEKKRPNPPCTQMKGGRQGRGTPFPSAWRGELPHAPGICVKRPDPRCVTSPATGDPWMQQQRGWGRPPTSLTLQAKTGPASPVREEHFCSVSSCLPLKWSVGQSNTH